MLLLVLRRRPRKLAKNLFRTDFFSFTTLISFSYTNVRKSYRPAIANSKTQIVWYVRLDMNTDSAQPNKVGLVTNTRPDLTVVLWQGFGRTQNKRPR